MSNAALDKFVEDIKAFCVSLQAFPDLSRLKANLRVLNEADLETLGIDAETLDTHRQSLYRAFLRGHILYNSTEYRKTDSGKLMILSFDESVGINPIAIFTNNIKAHHSVAEIKVLPVMKEFLKDHLQYLTEHYSRL